MNKTASLPATLGEALAQARGRIDTVDARVLLREASGATTARLIGSPETPLAADPAARYVAWLERRAAGEPVAYITGRREFYGRPYRVTPATLIPRPDTELLVELALRMIKLEPRPRLLDLGTGSGAIAISLALEARKAEVWAVDLSPAALDVARANALALGATVRFLTGSWFAPIGTERFDCIVSNPPYVAEGDPHLQQGDLRFEPLTALVASQDGLRDLQHIIHSAPSYLHPGGCLLVEHGFDQATAVRTLFEDAGFNAIESWRDLAGIERVSGGRLPA